MVRNISNSSLGIFLAMLLLCCQNLNPFVLSARATGERARISSDRVIEFGKDEFGEDLIILRESPNDPVITQTGDNFVAKLPSGWTSVSGGWTFENPASCFNSNGICFSDPATSYGSPTLPASDGTFNSFFQLNQNDAVVIFLRTPGRAAYFGFTQYLYSGRGSPPRVRVCQIL